MLTRPGNPLRFGPNSLGAKEGPGRGTRGTPAQLGRLRADGPPRAILTEPDKRHGGWDVEEFFASGRAEVDEAIGRLGALGLRPRRGRALDFGCGVGRLTQALAWHFDECVGVDIAPSMVEHARRYNRRATAAATLSTAPTTSRSSPTGTSISSIRSWSSSTSILQPPLHRRVPPRPRPGGVACFQVPARGARSPTTRCRTRPAGGGSPCWTPPRPWPRATRRLSAPAWRTSPTSPGRPSARPRCGTRSTWATTGSTRRAAASSTTTAWRSSH